MLTVLPVVGAIALGLALPLLVFAFVPSRTLTDAERIARQAALAGSLTAPGAAGSASGPAVAAVASASGAGRPVVPARDAVTADADHPGPFGWITPRALRARLDRDLGLAGLQQVWPLDRVLRAKAILTGVAVVLALLIGGIGRTPVAIAVAVLFVVVAYVAPDLVIGGRARERQAVIQRELADALDQITISIEAGLGLEAAMARVGAHGTGPLAQELTRTVQDMRVGFSRREAYQALADRTTVADLRRFARAILQADEYGISIGGVVRTQAAELRDKRRQRAEEKAMKVPVTVLFPLMVCILPVLFVVVLGPAAINLLGTVVQLGR
jgi:tight adherence protein C